MTANDTEPENWVNAHDYIEHLKSELDSMTRHYHIAKENEEKQLLTNRVLQDRINILNGMIDKAYDDIRELKKLKGM